MMPKTFRIPYKIPAIALVAGIIYFLFHFHFMQRYIDHDEIVYTYNIIYADQKPFVNPHHIHYEISGKLFNDFMNSEFGSDGFTDITFNLRLRSLLFGAIGIAAVIIYLASLTGKVLWGLAGALFIGFSHGYLLYAPKVDTAIFSAAWLPVMMLAGHYISRSKKWPIIISVISGIIFFAGVILHQYMVLCCAAVFLSLVIPSWIFSLKLKKPPFMIKKPESFSAIDKKNSTRYAAALMLTTVTCTLTVMAYFYSGMVYLNLSVDKKNTTWNWVYKNLTFQEWLFFYKTSNTWGKTDNKNVIQESFRGLTDTFLTPMEYGPKWNQNMNFDYRLDDPFNRKSFTFNLLAYFFIVMIVLTVVLLPSLVRRYGRDLVSIVLNCLLFSILGVYWEPFYVEFWIIPAMTIYFLIILLLNLTAEKLNILLRGFSQIPVYAITLFAIVMFAAHNFKYYVIPHSRSIYVDGVYHWKDDREYYMKLTGRNIYKHYLNPYRDVYGQDSHLHEYNSKMDEK